MTQSNDCPIAKWLASVGYTGSPRGGTTTLYPEDVARLSNAVDAKVESACATIRAECAWEASVYKDVIAHAQKTAALQEMAICRLKAEIASLRGSGTVGNLHETLGDIFRQAVARQGRP